MEQLDLTREVAEKVLKRAMAPIRAILEGVADDRPEWDDDQLMNISIGQLKELDKDLGTLGVALANRYREQVEYQTTLGVLSTDNARLHAVIAELATLAEKYKGEGDHLANELAKLRNVTNKLKEIQPVNQGFHAS